jgi:hypothetical protein
LYRHAYPHKYAHWEACLITNVLFFGLINTWSSIDDQIVDEEILFKDVLDVCCEHFFDIDGFLSKHAKG